MDDLDRRDQKFLAYIERSLRDDGVRYELGQTAAKMNGFEDVLKNSPKVDPGNIIRKDRHRTVSEIQRSNIIEPKNMIYVAVRDQNRVKIIDAGTKGLLTKIR